MRWGRGLIKVSRERTMIWDVVYSFKEAGFRTTSFGISANGVLEVGGVLMNDGGKPGGSVPAKPLRGLGVLVAGVVP